jgi:hypothetical protein
MTFSTFRLLSVLAAFAATATLTLASSAPLPAKAQTAALAVPSIAA